MPEIVKIAELNIDTNKLITSLKETKNSIDVLAKANKTLKAEGEGASESFIRNEATLKTLKAEYNGQVKVLGTVTNGTNKLNNELQKEIKGIDEAKNSNAELIKIRNQINTKTVEGAKQVEAINKKVDENNKIINKNSSVLEKQKQNIGNYASGLLQTNPILANMAMVLGEVRTGLIAKNVAMKASEKSTGGASKALRIFKLALLGTGIGAVVLILGTLITFLTTTQKGIDSVTKVTRPLQAIFQSLIGVVQNLGGTLATAFTSPKKTLEELSNFVKNNLINRFKAFGVILDGIINLDFKKITNGVLQAGTGVENLINKTQKATKVTGDFLSDAIGKGTEIDNLTKKIEKSENNLILTRAENIKLIKQQELIANDSSKSLAERNKASQTAIKLSNQLATEELKLLDDKIKRKEIENSLNDTSREDEKALNLLIAERSKKEEEASARELQFLSVKSAVNNEAKAKEKALNDEKIAQQKEAEEEEIQRLKLLSEEKIQLAKFELNDYIRNNFSKLENEKFFSEESLKIEQKRLDDLAQKQRDFAKLQLEEGKLSKIEYDEAIAVIDFNNKQKQDEAVLARKEAQKEADAIDLENKLILEEEQFQNQFELASERLELQRQRDVAEAEKTGADITLINENYSNQQQQIEEQLGQARLSAVSNTLGNVSTLLGKHTAAGKAAGIAQATINTFQGVTEVWKAPAVLPEPFNTASKVASSAVTLGAGLATVKKIKSVKTPKAERGMLLKGKRHSEGGIMLEAEDGEVVINRKSSSTFLPLLSQINQAGGGVPFMKNGGVAGRINLPSSNLIDLDMLAEKMAEANQSIPAPVVSVEEIATVNNNISVIENNSIF